MADIKIANLTAKTTWADTDIIIVEDSSDTKKMTVATLKSLLAPASPTFHAIELTADYSADGGNNYPAQYWKDSNGYVHFRGKITRNNSNFGGLGFTLPAGFGTTKRVDLTWATIIQGNGQFYVNISVGASLELANITSYLADA